MTIYEIRTGMVAPDEALGPPNHVRLVFSQVLVKVFNGNHVSLLKKMKDTLPRFVLFVFVLEIVPSFHSIIYSHFSMLELCIPEDFWFLKVL